MTGTTPLGAVIRGLVAGAVGTLAMDTLLYWRYRRGGGKDSFRTWEFSSTVRTWDDVYGTTTAATFAAVNSRN
ncbi:hypothetical protein M1L60_06095 [Actinoplanes sp. TRM 88003]|uniref:Uncharacterized protein n=1 Tax=Paractinoplanes aksuensis TaxID=2939490 RepID=A0ABT1DH57_9ACTN|nr:hypothetical protein [Actinoplanes aksuensis]MCO8270162.1 hypothetical protein [Actinoplanes aksuensis]